MTRLQFREFLSETLELTDVILMDRIYKLFNHSGGETLDTEDWINGLSVFLKGAL